MIKYFMVVMAIMLSTGETVYNSAGACLKYDTAKQCTEARTDLVNNFKQAPDGKLFVSLCVPFEITEDFNQENSVEACRQVKAKGMKIYGGAAEMEFP